MALDDTEQALTRQLKSLRATVERLGQTVEGERTDRTQVRASVTALERDVARLMRIVDGDPAIGFGGLRADIQALRQQSGTEIVAIRTDLTALRREREAETNQRQGMALMLRTVAGVTGIGFLAQLAQLFGLIQP